jgi:uncharacterized YigZ family protein
VYTVTKCFQSDYRIKGSKFLGYLSPAACVNVVNNLLDRVKSEHPTATHHCFGYVINPNEPEEFASDDGEPGGTAGLPILNTIRSHNLMNVLLVVVRYYGGTKLGKAGLIDAYSHSAELTIKQAELKRILPIKTVKITYGYQHQGIIDKLKNDFTWIELGATYLEKVVLECGCPIDESGHFLEKLRSLKHLFDDLEITGDSFHIVE